MRRGAGEFNKGFASNCTDFKVIRDINDWACLQ